VNWKPWIHGLAAAAVSGMGSALAALAVGIDMRKVGLMILVQMGIGVGLFLKQSPLPEDRQVWTPEQRESAKAQAAGK
jgi:hypothetical protein